MQWFFASFFKVFINIHEYVNEIIFIQEHWMKGLVKLYCCWYKNLQQWWFGDGFLLKFVYLWYVFIILPHF